MQTTRNREHHIKITQRQSTSVPWIYMEPKKEHIPRKKKKKTELKNEKISIYVVEFIRRLIKKINFRKGEAIDMSFLIHISSTCLDKRKRSSVLLYVEKDVLILEMAVNQKNQYLKLDRKGTFW